MYKSSDVAERIKYMAKLRGQTMKVVLEEAGLNFNAMTHMKTSMPKADNLAKLADYLRCSVDFLLGRPSRPGPPRRPWSWPGTGWRHCLGERFRYPSPC